jgi:hypothetical protein
MAPTSRIEAARRRASALKRVLAAGAAAAFVVTGIAARLTHPGNAAASSSRAGSTGNRATTSISGDEQSQSLDGFTIAPSTAAPQAQTSVS